jgi:hypothetical protein
LNVLLLGSQQSLGVEGGDKHGWVFPRKENFGNGNALHALLQNVGAVH